MADMETSLGNQQKYRSESINLREATVANEIRPYFLISVP
jgi:hypothetical protein